MWEEGGSALWIGASVWGAFPFLLCALCVWWGRLWRVVGRDRVGWRPGGVAWRVSLLARGVTGSSRGGRGRVSMPSFP